MIDWHCHILPGLDDGSADIEQSLSMAKLLVAKGYSRVYCTPHQIFGCYEASNDQVREGIKSLQRRIDAEKIPLSLLSGREYYLDEYLLAALKDPLPLGDSRQILVEIPSHSTVAMAQQLLYEVVRAGFTPVIAHPERCLLLAPARRNPEKRGPWSSLRYAISRGSMRKATESSGVGSGNQLLDYLLDLGCSFQGNLGSFSGFHGQRAKATAETMRSMGIYDRYGSDLHAPQHAEHVLG